MSNRSDTDDGHEADVDTVSSTVDRVRPSSFPGAFTRTTTVIQTRTWGDQNGTGNLRPGEFWTGVTSCPTTAVDYASTSTQSAPGILTPRSNNSTASRVSSTAQVGSEVDDTAEKTREMTLDQAKDTLALLRIQQRKLQTMIREAQVTVGLKMEEESRAKEHAASVAGNETNTNAGRTYYVPSDPTVRNERSMNCE